MSICPVPVDINFSHVAGCLGAWVAHSVLRPALDLGSGYDLTVHVIEPCVKLCPDGVEPAWDSLSPSLCPSPTRALSLSK